MKKVVQLRSSGGLLGAERVILELSQCLPQYGFESIVVALWDEGDEYPALLVEAKAKGLKCHAIKCRGKFDFSAFRALKQFCREEEIDLLHCHGYKEDIFGLFVDLPKIATNHLWKRSTFLSKVYSYLDAIALRFYRKIVAVSQPVYVDMRKVFLPESKLSVIANGIDPSPFTSLALSGGSDNLRESFAIAECPILLTVSSLTLEKGHQTLLAALEDLKRSYQGNFKLIIVGDGPERSSLEREVEQKDLTENVMFLGERKDIAQLLSIADIYVLPSYREGLPIALLEAMAAKKAIIASDVGDVSLALDDGSAGMLVAARDVKGLSNSIQELLQDSEKRNAFALLAHQRVLDKFSADAMSKSYAACYRDLLS